MMLVNVVLELKCCIFPVKPCCVFPKWVGVVGRPDPAVSPMGFFRLMYSMLAQLGIMVLVT